MDLLCSALRRLAPVDSPTAVMDELLRVLAGRASGSDNSLAPGFDSFELSYSEADPHALRVDWEPGGTPEERLAAAPGWVDDGSAAFKAISATVLNSPPKRPVFGAYLGCTLRPQRSLRKLYLEVDRWDGLPEELAALAELPGVTQLMPHFVSLVTGDGPMQARLYLSNPEPLPLIALHPLLECCGLHRVAPKFLQRVSRLLGGQWTLPADCGVLGLRRTTAGILLKLDILHPKPVRAPVRWPGDPQSQSAWSAWQSNVEQEVGPSFLGAAGVSCGPNESLHTTAYLRFNGFCVREGAISV